MSKKNRLSPVSLAYLQRKRQQKRRALGEFGEDKRCLQNTIQSLPIPIGIADQQGKTLLYNRKFTEVYGYSLEDVPTLETWLEKVYSDPEYRQQIEGFWQADIEQLSLPDNSILREQRLTCKDGSTRDVEITAHRIGNFLISAFMDITERKYMLDELSLSEEKYRELFNTMLHGVVYQNADGKITSANPAAERILGQSLEQMQGKQSVDPRWRAVHEDGSDFLGETHPAMVALKTGQPVRNVVMGIFNPATNAYRWININAVPQIREGESQPYQVYATFEDITGRKQAEQKLLKSEQRFRALIENSADALTLLDAQGFIIEEGPTVQRLTGYAPSDRLGKSSLEYTFPADLPSAKKAFADLLTTPGRSVSLELRAIRKDGSTWWVDCTATNLLDDPNVQAIVVNYRDMTARKQADAELRSGERRFRTLFEHAGAGIAQGRAATGQFIKVNQKFCEIVGYTREELESSDFIFMTHPEDLQPNLDLLEQLRRGVIREFTMEKRYIRKNGTIVWVLLTVSPLWKPGEPPDTYITVVHDITEQKRAELSLRYSEAEIRKLNAELERRVEERTRQLEVANKELEAFAYSVSHDLRAPLRAVDGFSRILMNEYAGELSGEARDLLGKVRQASGQMGQLIEALLGLSRMSRAELRREDVDLSRLASGILENLAREHPERQLDWIVADQALAHGDPRLLRVVLENLLENACKFASKRERARIEFGVEVNNGTRTYFVRDNGVGFNPRYADKLFGAFQRLHRADEFEGTGIGLATVQRIIHRHGGHIWAESELGQGATFYFTLDE